MVTNACRLLVVTPDGTRPLGISRHKWVDNIKIDLGEREWANMDWTVLVQRRNQWRALVNAVVNRRVP
jgi:hypothetical protein